MSVFPKTRAAAGYIAGAGPGELARARAASLLARIGACDDILPAGGSDVPAALPGRLDRVLMVRGQARVRARPPLEERTAHCAMGPAITRQLPCPGGTDPGLSSSSSSRGRCAGRARSAGECGRPAGAITKIRARYSAHDVACPQLR